MPLCVGGFHLGFGQGCFIPECCSKFGSNLGGGTYCIPCVSVGLRCMCAPPPPAQLPPAVAALQTMWMGLCCGLQRKPPAVTDGSPGKTKKKFKGPLSILGNQTVVCRLSPSCDTRTGPLKRQPGGRAPNLTFPRWCLVCDVASETPPCHPPALLKATRPNPRI